MATAVAMLKKSLKGPIGVYCLVTLAVMTPLLTPGHILTLDMAFTPNLPVPAVTSSSFLFRLALHLFNLIIPADVIEKALLLMILIAAQLGMHRLLAELQPKRRNPSEPVWGIYLASVIYAVNPFTYSRFMAGQYSVLLGYALLPFFTYALLGFLQKPAWRTSLHLAAYTLAISIVSIHSLGMVAILAVCALAGELWRHRNDAKYLRTVGKHGAFALIIVIVLSSYWLVPLLTGVSTAGQAVRSFDSGDRLAYATVGSGTIGKFIHVIRLQGFWAEARGLYLLPQDYLPAWGLATVGVWFLVWAGVRETLRSQRRYEAFVFGMSGLLAVVIAVWGVSDGAIRLLPGLSGFREPHKFVSLVALAFAYFIAQGLPAVVRRLGQKSETLATGGLCAAYMLAALWTPTMWWGFAGQLRPRAYPADWFIVNQRLNRDTQNFETLFLPWHLYMHFRFAGRIIVNPAEDFFDKPVIVSNDPELAGSSPTGDDALKRRLSNRLLPEAAADPRFADRLAGENIKYILLAKETDTAAYEYLDGKPGLERIYDGRTLVLYLNKSWEKHDGK